MTAPDLHDLRPYGEIVAMAALGLLLGFIAWCVGVGVGLLVGLG